MSVQDSNLEALAFNYVSYGILAVVNNLWTWIAVVTAAVSFWRIRATAAAAASPVIYALPSDDRHRMADIDRSEPALSIATATDGRRRRLVEEPPAAVLTTVSSPSLNGDGATKGKFTVHFGDYDGGSDNDDSDGDGELTAVSEDDGEFGKYWWETWERVLRIRGSGDEWYRYQDLTAINRNVVRLWDQNRTISILSNTY